VSSNDSGYNVRLYMPGDEEGIVEVLKTSYPEWRDAKSPLKHWKWKYLDNSYSSHVVVADWDGKIVGVQQRLYLSIKVDEKISSAYGDDGAVHPDYRRKGIYKNMIRYIEELLKKKKIVLKFGIQIHEASEKMFERLGQVHFPFPISHMLQIKDVKTHFKKRPAKNNLVARIGFSVLKFLNRLKNIISHSETNSEIEVEDISLFDDRINSFWENIRDDYNFIIEKNVEYLNWRYCDSRSNLKGKYYVKQAVKNNEILGFIVLETRRKDDYSEGYIVDLLTLPGRTAVARKLLAEASLFFRESDINVVHYRVVKNHPYQAIFSKQGFIEVPSKLHLTIKFFREKEKMQIIKDSKPSQIHFNYGDYY
jgi:GNAT superfamily N-acetyltransferase